MRTAEKKKLWWLIADMQFLSKISLEICGYVVRKCLLQVTEL
jgi:hypothetical protein